MLIQDAAFPHPSVSYRGQGLSGKIENCLSWEKILKSKDLTNGFACIPKVNRVT